MNREQIAWRIKFAQYLFEKVKTIEGIKACFIGGSVCRNMADEYSDLEICFVWENPIADSEKLLFNKKWGGKCTHSNHNKTLNQIEESFHFNGFQVDVYRTSINATNTIINGVLENHDIQFDKLIHLNVLQNAIPLFGNAVLENWKEQIREYPNEIAVAMIEKYTQKFFMADAPIFIFRKDWTIFYSLIAGYQKNIFLVLTALNKAYFSGFKYSIQHIKSMRIKPSGILETYDQLYQLSPNEMWQSIVDLKLQVLDLIVEHFPNVEINHIYERKNQGRKKFSKSPIAEE